MGGDSSGFTVQLYKGAQSTPCYFQSPFIAFFQYSIWHSLTSKALEELLHLMSVSLPSDAMLPKSVHQLRKFFTNICPEQQPHFCSNCHELEREDEPLSCACGAEKSVFIDVPIGPQQCILLSHSDPLVWEAIQSRKKILHPLCYT